MADEEKQDDEVMEGDGKKSSGGMKKWIIIGVVLLVVLALEAGIAVLIIKTMIPKDANEVATEQQQAAEDSLNREKTWMGTTLEKPISVIVNIGQKGDRYLKCGLQLEFDGIKYPMLATELELRKPKIKDLIIGILATKPIVELSSSQGKMNIRKAIVSDINGMLPGEIGKIRSCYFDEFLIQ